MASAVRHSQFAHECVHVWQNQHFGSSATAEAVGNQWWGIEYDWEQESKAAKEWEEFEREAQGESIEDIYLGGGTVAGATGNGAFFAEDDEAQRVFVVNGVTWTQLANAAVRYIRGHTPWRSSELFS